MPHDDYYLTEEGHRNLEKEYARLKSEGMPNVLKRVSEARELGNLEDNQEYEVAQHEKDVLEGKIMEIEEILRKVKIVSAGGRKTSGRVAVGSTITVEVRGDLQTFTIVGSVEADPSKGKLSHESPVGQHLLGLKEGDIVEIKLPNTTVEYRIIKIHK